MTLCLMVYSFTQYYLRQALQAAEASVPDERRKPTNKPSIKRIFKLFQGVQVLTLTLETGLQIFS